MMTAIIGTGAMAKALGQRLTRAGEPILIAGRDRTKARGLAASLGESAIADDIAGVARWAEVLVLAVPYAAVGEALLQAGNLAGKVLIDITNPITPDFMALTIGHTSSAAEEIQKLAPTASVVKAFNTLFASVLSSPASIAGIPQVFTAADDREAEMKVAALIRRMGLAPVYAGPLMNARYLEPLGELNIQLGYRFKHGTLISPAWTGISQ